MSSLSWSGLCCQTPHFDIQAYVYPLTNLFMSIRKVKGLWNSFLLLTLSKPLWKAFMEIIIILATRRSEGRRARCITRTTTWPTSSSPRTSSRRKYSTGPCSTSAARSSSAATGVRSRSSSKDCQHCLQGPQSTRTTARVSSLWTLTRSNGMRTDP